jgi:hypothetical protein
MHAASMMRWRCQRIPLHRALCALQLPSPFCPHRSHRQGAIMLFNAALTKRSPYWLSPGSISTSCYHHLLSPPKTPNITPNDTKTARHSTTPISTMSQDKGNRRLIECLALARERLHRSSTPCPFTRRCNPGGRCARFQLYCETNRQRSFPEELPRLSFGRQRPLGIRVSFFF